MQLTLDSETERRDARCYSRHSDKARVNVDGSGRTKILNRTLEKPRKGLRMNGLRRNDDAVRTEAGTKKITSLYNVELNSCLTKIICIHYETHTFQPPALQNSYFGLRSCNG